VQLQEAKDLMVRLNPPDGNELLGSMLLSSKVPVKGLMLTSTDDGVVWEDNCVDLVPNEVVEVGVKGLTLATADALDIKYLGMP